MTMLLVVGLAGLAVFAPLFLTHAAYVYVIALTYSSTGEDRFRWPSELMTEWPAHAFPLLGIGFVASALCFTLTAPLLAILTWEQYAVCFAVFLYLGLPLAVASVFTAPSKLLLIYPPTIGRLIRQTAGVAKVHAITLPFSTGVGVGLFLFFRGNPFGLLLIVACLPLAVLLHARAWGRLLWLALNYDLPEPRKRKKRRGPRPTPSGEVLESPSLEAIPQEDDDAYDVGGTSTPSDAAKVNLTDYYEKQRAHDVGLRVRAGTPNPDPIVGPERPTFQSALGGKIWPFLFYEGTIGKWIAMTVLCYLAFQMLFLVLRIMGNFPFD